MEERWEVHMEEMEDVGEMEDVEEMEEMEEMEEKVQEMDTGDRWGSSLVLQTRQLVLLQRDTEGQDNGEGPGRGHGRGLHGQTDEVSP